MPSVARIREQLPGLWRPEPEHDDLLARFLNAAGGLLDGLRGEHQGVLQSHWWRFADSASFSPFVLRDRTLAGLPPLDPFADADREFMDSFPYLVDLARLGALLGLPPWREPLALRERVEAYRTRLRRFVMLYRSGLGTRAALRAITEAFLDPDFALPLPERDRPFSVEEFVPLAGAFHPVTQDGVPLDLVGPLMRWEWSNASRMPAAAALYVQGLQPEDGEIAATEDPLIELYRDDDETVALGIAFRGTLAPDETLRLRPAFRAWRIAQGGLQVARSVATDAEPADPTAAGPWASVADAPAGEVTAFLQTADRMLWVAVDDAGAAALWRNDGRSWSEALAAPARVHALAEDGQSLLVGADTGLVRVALYPEGTFAAAPIAGMQGQAVHALLHGANGEWWIGAAAGAFNLLDGDVVEEAPLQGTAVLALAEQADGTIYFGGPLGLFQYQPGTDDWYWYHGESESDQVPDWEPYEPGALPEEDDVFLPAVHSILPDAHASLWLGTAAGMARYRARDEGGLSYKTLLEAFPDLTRGVVAAVRADERGLTWLATERGLFRYDGRDLVQFRDGEARWVSQGRADQLYPDDVEPQERGAWRFDRGLAEPAWQRFDHDVGQWLVPPLDLRSTAEPAVADLLWTDDVDAALGSFDGSTFTASSPVDPASLRMRFKPAEDRIVDGGLPAVPRIPPGTSTWRYLALDPDDFVAPDERPYWSREGRLFPPPQLAAPLPGRYGEGPASPPPQPPSDQRFDETVFAYLPAARVWFEWAASQPLTVAVRLYARAAGEIIDPSLLDRVWDGIQRVRPAGVKALLAVDQSIIRGV